MDMIYAEDRTAWRDWLQENYKSQKEVWLVYYKKASGRSSITYEQAVEEAIAFGWIDGIRKSVDDISYKQRFTPRKPNSIWSLINKNYAKKAISEGRMTAEGLALVEAAKKSGKWDAAYSMKGEQEMPEDLEKALKENGRAWANFQQYSNSNKFVFLVRLGRAKDPEKRAEKIRRIVELAEQNLKPNGPDRKPLI